jgi:hypothetical protein
MTVQDLLDQILPRIQGDTGGASIYDALNATITIINNRLWAKKSDLARKGFEVTMTLNVATVTMPADFLGLAEQPYVDGTSSTLSPLPTGSRASFTQTGTPAYFELEDKTLTLFPTPEKTGKVKGKYFYSQAAFDELTDVIPYGNVFNEIIKDTVLQVLNVGMAITADKNFQLSLIQSVDELIGNRSAMIPYRRSVQFF